MVCKLSAFCSISIVWLCVQLTCWTTIQPVCAQDQADFPEVFNTEAAGQQPPAAEEMPGLIEVPSGFNVTLFAAEPDIQQPICMDFDDRGRMWVAENYTYSGGPYETKLRDRIVILEDTDADGQHDKRTVFWDRGFMLTSLAWGFGGVWILHDGTLTFIADENGDDIPDGEPEVVLDGWSKDCGHNFVNGLMWGPDGWMYGRHGIVDTSYPAVPGTPLADRLAINCGVWRYHPTKRIVEAVCHGTTNPWGLDYNADGHFFMTNNVQGHLWHVLPGAHYQRMYGQDFNPHFYELMDMTADHYHWDTTRKWNESRDGVANDLGGGHSHVGGLIYQGSNFPSEYRGKIFMCNTHGRRLNVNRLERTDSGFVGKREPDFMQVKTPWFRGVDIKLGPDGAMFVADWSDNGECHDHDGIHRTSGRIYRIAYGSPEPFKPVVPLAELDSDALLQMAVGPDAWHARHALRILQERQQGAAKLSVKPIGADGKLLPLLITEALGLLSDDVLHQWLQTTDIEQLEHAVQLAAGNAHRRREFLPDLIGLAGQQPRGNVLMALISVLQRYQGPERLELVAAIVAAPRNVQMIAGDNNLTLMMWYGVEPVINDVSQVRLLQAIPKLQAFAVRRLAHEIQPDNQIAGQLLSMIAERVAEGDVATAAELIGAFRHGLTGRARVAPPQRWNEIEQRLRASGNAEIEFAIDALGVLFGDGAALADLRALAADGSQDPITREDAIKALAQANDAEAIPIYFGLLDDRAVADAAIRALATVEHPQTANQLLNRLEYLKDGNRGLALDTLISRQSYALALVDALESDAVEAHDLSATQVRQLLAFPDARIRTVLEEKWGVVQDTPEAKLAAMERWRQALTEESLAQADLEKGREIFQKSCANCHKLYGEGATIGPDLTGSNRGNLDYLLMNIIDPSSVVPKQFTTSVIALDGGRVITGVIVGQTDTSLTIQTDKEQLTVLKDEIEASRDSGKSLMPDGMLDALTPEQIRDLFAYMMHRR